MKTSTLRVFAFFSVCAVAQQTGSPELKLRIVNEKEKYDLNETVVLKAEFTNLTSETLCFPVPDQECSVPATGWMQMTGYAPNRDTRFICHMDGQGPVGEELESNVREHWLKIAPNAVYVISATHPLMLNKAGDWQLIASYHPPEGSFSAKYKNMLKSAAAKSGCQVPLSSAEAEPVVIHVHSSDRNGQER